jgi:hypothetical protein
MKADLGTLGLGDLPEAALALAGHFADDGVELGRRWSIVAELKMNGVPETDPVYLAAVEDARVLAALILQRAELRLRAMFENLADEVLQALGKIVLTAVVAAI